MSIYLSRDQKCCPLFTPWALSAWKTKCHCKVQICQSGWAASEVFLFYSQIKVDWYACVFCGIFLFWRRCLVVAHHVIFVTIKQRLVFPIDAEIIEGLTLTRDQMTASRDIFRKSLIIWSPHFVFLAWTAWFLAYLLGLFSKGGVGGTEGPHPNQQSYWWDKQDSASIDLVHWLVGGYHPLQWHCPLFLLEVLFSLKGISMNTKTSQVISTVTVTGLPQNFRIYTCISAYSEAGLPPCAPSQSWLSPQRALKSGQMRYWLSLGISLLALSCPPSSAVMLWCSHTISPSFTAPLLSLHYCLEWVFEWTVST